MLHKPKISTLKHLHSIPRYFMHSIPIMSLVALLTLTLFTINPSPHNIQAYAIEDTNVRDTISTTNSNNDLDTVEREDSTVSKANNETMPLAAGDTTASLEILTGNLTEITPASTGNVSYRSHNISYSVQNPMDYTLRVSYASGNRALQYYGPNGTTVSTAGTTISGVGDGVEANNIPDNSWGFAWSDNTETANEAMTYYTMPTNNSSTGLSNGVLTSGTESIDDTGKLTFAAKFASDAIAGHYKTQVLLSLAAMPHTVVYQVTYDCNGGTGCPSNMSNESTASSYQYTIPSTAPAKSGYKFLGYNTSSTVIAPDSRYNPGSAVNLTTSNSALKLYAVWVTPTTPIADWNSLEYMQQMTPEACVAAGTASSTNYPIKTLIDSRDNNTYTIKKLEDGRCWMTSNLRIANKTITPDDSNVTKNYTITAQDTDSKFSQTGVYYNNNDYSAITNGAYYSWYAATAANNGDICPSRWMLPSKSAYENLLTAANIKDANKFHNAPYNFPYAGAILDNSLNYAGLQGTFWLNSNYDVIFINNSANQNLIGFGHDTRLSGFSVRCIAK